MRMRLVLLFFLAISLISPVLSAVAQDGATLRLATRPIAGATAQSPLPDPIKVLPSDTDTQDLLENLYVGLFRFDAETSSAVPVLATAWTVSDDGLTWTFTLRDDIQWVGYNPDRTAVAALRPVAAQDVVTAIERACHPLKPTPASPAMFAIRGCYTASQANRLLVTDEMVSGWIGAEAPDNRTLVLETAYPIAYLPSLLTQPEFRPIPREFVAFTPAWPMIASSGPYVLTEWTLNESLTLTRNPLWPDELPGNIEQVIITFAEDEAARAEIFSLGDADMTRLQGPSGPALYAQWPDAVQIERGDRVTLLGFSTERAFVNTAGVRQALAWTLNREALVAGNAFALGTGKLTPSSVIAGPKSVTGMGFEPEAARAALAGAGFANCFGVPEVISIAVPAEQVSTAEQITALWSQELGCAPGLFEIVPTRPDDLRDIARGLIDEDTSRRPHIWMAEWTIDYNDAHGGAADAFHCKFGYFRSGIGCGPVDGLIDWAGSTASGDERPDIYARIEARLFGSAGLYPAVPLWTNVVYVGVTPDLSRINGEGPAWWGSWTKS